MEPFRGQTLCVTACDDLVVVVHGAEAPSDGEWSELLRQGVKLRPRALLVFTPPGCPGPSAKQRGAAAATWLELGYQAPIALITESRLLRGALLAIQWITKQPATAYAPSDLERACDALALDPDARVTMRQVAFELAQHLGVAPALSYLNPSSDSRSVAS